MKSTKSLFPELDANFPPAVDRTEPSVWIRRLVVVDRREPDVEPIRCVDFRRGLNIIATEPPSPEDRRPVGHNVGKTLLTRLIRYCLGEQHLATESVRKSLGRVLPDGYVLAEIVVNAVSWVVARPMIFDSKLTTYANLNKLNRQGVQFITLRRRDPKLMQHLAAQPRSAWRRIELEGVSRIYKTPRILDQRITLTGYDGPLRQITVAELGHEDPTLLLTNQMRRSAAKLIGRYARRMLIENNIADGVNFFHLDALSSAVALKVNCDVQLTLMASSLYRHLGQRIGQGYERAKSQEIFLDFVDANATLLLDERSLVVRFQKRAHNPLLIAAGFNDIDLRIPWLGNKHLQFQFG
jgi:hypothetical protein